MIEKFANYSTNLIPFFFGMLRQRFSCRRQGKEAGEYVKNCQQLDNNYWLDDRLTVEL